MGALGREARRRVPTLTSDGEDLGSLRLLLAQGAQRIEREAQASLLHLGGDELAAADAVEQALEVHEDARKVILRRRMRLSSSHVRRVRSPSDTCEEAVSGVRRR